MNPRQRRGLLVLVLAAVGGLVVFLGVSTYVAHVREQLGPMTTVFVANRDIPPFAPVLPSDLHTEEIPVRWVPSSTVTQESDFLGEKAAGAIQQGTHLTREMLVPSSSLADGMREVSVDFVGDQGINGRVQPGDLVDVVAAFAARQRSGQTTDPSIRRAELPFNIAGIIVRNARVVSVGEKTPVGVAVGGADEGNPQPSSVVPVTFAVSVADATRLAYAEAFSVTMRIMRSGNNETGTKVHPGDTSFSDQLLPTVLQPPAKSSTSTPAKSPQKESPKPTPKPTPKPGTSAAGTTSGTSR